jgi:hypothetical protein
MVVAFDLLCAYPGAMSSVAWKHLPLAEPDAAVIDFYARHPEMYLTARERDAQDTRVTDLPASGAAAPIALDYEDKLTLHCWRKDSLLELLRVRGKAQREPWRRDPGQLYVYMAPTVNHIAITLEMNTGPLAVKLSWLHGRRRPLRDVKLEFHWPQKEWIGVTCFEDKPLPSRLHFADLAHWTKRHRRASLLEYIAWRYFRLTVVHRDAGIHGLARDNVYRYVRGWGYDKLWIGHDKNTGEAISRSVGHPLIEYQIGVRRRWQWHGLASLLWFLSGHALPYTRRDLLGHVSRMLLVGSTFRGSRLRMDKRDIFRLFGMLQSDFERMVKQWRAHHSTVQNTSGAVVIHPRCSAEVVSHSS